MSNLGCQWLLIGGKYSLHTKLACGPVEPHHRKKNIGREINAYAKMWLVQRLKTGVNNNLVLLCKQQVRGQKASIQNHYIYQQ